MKKGFAQIIALFVGITIAIVMVANVVLPTVFNVNTSLPINASNLSRGYYYQWDAGTIAMWSIVGISIVALLILLMYRGG